MVRWATWIEATKKGGSDVYQFSVVVIFFFGAAYYHLIRVENYIDYYQIKIGVKKKKDGSNLFRGDLQKTKRKGYIYNKNCKILLICIYRSKTYFQQ